MIAEALSIMMPQRRAMVSVPGPEDDYWYYPIGSPATSGVVVTPAKSLGVSAVYGCVRVLRESLGSLPWRVYERVDERNKEQARDHYLWEVLHDRPNSWQTPLDFKEQGVTHLCLRGNFYCKIVQPMRSEMELWPLNPDRMTVEQQANMTLRYTYREQDGAPIIMQQEEVFHVRGLSLNGVNGVSVLEFARNAIGAAIAQEDHGSSLFKNGALPTFWISRPAERKWTATARQNFRDEWKAVHAGAENAGQPPILGDGMELHELGLTNRDSQWIEARGFSAEEICRFFGVHPHMIGVRSTAPMGSIEQQSLEFVLYTLGPLAVRFEQAANRDLLDGDDDHYTKIVLDALLRADLKSRYEAHNISVQGGWGLVNEVREIEDRNPIEGGDEPRFPLNMQPAGGGPDEQEQGGQPGKGQPKQLIPDEEADEDEDEEPTRFQKRRAAVVEPLELTAHEQWQAKAEAVRPMFEILLAEAAARIASHEITHLEKRAKLARDDRERWDTWATKFYGTHRAYIEKTLDPISAAWLSQTGGHAEPESVAQCLTNGDGEIFNPDRDPSDVLEEWRQTRAADHSDRLQTLFFGGNGDAI